MTEGFRISLSSLTLGTLYESILTFSGHDRLESFWPALCQNARWIIPSRRMCILLCEANNSFGVAGSFEKGTFSTPENWHLDVRRNKFWRACANTSPVWIANPHELISGEPDDLSNWLFHDKPETLFVLPMNAKGKNVGALLFVVGPIDQADRAMVTALGTVYALHAGMTYLLIHISEERQRQEKELRKTEYKYSVLFQSSNDGIFLVDTAGNIEDTNQRALEMFGYTKQEMTSLQVFDLHPSSELHITQMALDELIHTGRVRFTVECKKRSGQVFPAEISASLFEIEGRKIAHGLVRDITELKRAMDEVKQRAQDLNEKNTQLQQTLAELRDMQQQLIMQEKMASLGTLVAGVAHEVNNPIGAVNSASDVLSRGIDIIQNTVAAGKALEDIKENAKFHRTLEMLRVNSAVIATAAQRITKIVRSLKDFARLDEAEFKEADIHKGLDSTLTFVGHELKDKVQVIRDYGDIPLTTCYPHLLNQVFMNLLLNALQAIVDKGTIRIETSADGRNVYIRVSDNGKGILPEHLARIFDPGFTTKGMGIGSGLGLSICYSIMQKHKGTIDVESQVGKGTTFTLKLPIATVRL